MLELSCIVGTHVRKVLVLAPPSVSRIAHTAQVGCLPTYLPTQLAQPIKVGGGSGEAASQRNVSAAEMADQMGERTRAAVALQPGQPPFHSLARSS